jgi:hypothetical protein
MNSEALGTGAPPSATMIMMRKHASRSFSSIPEDRERKPIPTPKQFREAEVLHGRKSFSNEAQPSMKISAGFSSSALIA